MAEGNGQPGEGRRLTPDEFRDVIGSFASGVTVITALHDDTPFGTTASAVSSLSLEPPMLLICMSRESSTGQAVAASGRFAVNILTEDQEQEAVRFAGKGDKFKGVRLDSGEQGEPLLAGALATLECRVTEEVTGGTHTVFLAEVERASGSGSGAPLAYFRGEFGRLTTQHDESALAEIRRRVLHRDIAVGEPLDLDALAGKLDVPRGSLYRGLAELAEEGLVDRDEAGAFVVPPVTLEAIRDAMPALFAIWLGAVQLTIGDTSEYEIAQLRRLAEALRPTADDWGAERFVAARTEFVHHFLGLSGSVALVEAWDRVDVPSLITLHWSGQAAPARADYERLHRGFDSVVDAYETGDGQAAVEAIRDFQAFVLELFSRTFERQESI